MRVKINGKEKRIDLNDGNAYLTTLLKAIGYKPNSIVVELNGLIVNSKKWNEVLLKDGDCLEIVSIVGGG